MIKATNKLEHNSKMTNSNIINETTVLGGRVQGEPFTGVMLLQVMLGHWPSLL